MDNLQIKTMLPQTSSLSLACFMKCVIYFRDF